MSVGPEGGARMGVVWSMSRAHGVGWSRDLRVGSELRGLVRNGLELQPRHPARAQKYGLDS